MGFPQTRLTLIRRLSGGGGEDDWQQFLTDYWGAICRFASRWGGLSPEDAEDVASKTFEVILLNRLLARWCADRSAKLRTLLCSVARNVLSNRARVSQGRKRRLQEYLEKGRGDGALRVDGSPDPTADQTDAFYSAWVENLLQQSVDSLMKSLHASGKGDCFRVLYGRLCDGMTMPQISDALGITTTMAENHFKAAKRRLAESLQEHVRRHVLRYSDAADAAAEFDAEWKELADFLQQYGGLEQAVRRVHGDALSSGRFDEASKSLTAIRNRLRNLSNDSDRDA